MAAVEIGAPGTKLFLANLQRIADLPLDITRPFL